MLDEKVFIPKYGETIFTILCSDENNYKSLDYTYGRYQCGIQLQFKLASFIDIN